MKKKFYRFSVIVCTLLLCLSLCACGARIEICIIRTVGTFSGCRVEVARFESRDELVGEVVVEYSVDDVYIGSLPSSAYEYLVYTDETHWTRLRDAYEDGVITHDDLLAIAEAEKPYDLCES